MERVYIVRGVNPGGGVVEHRLAASSTIDAKAAAERAGLRHGVVEELPFRVVPTPPSGPGKPSNRWP